MKIEMGDALTMGRKNFAPSCVGLVLQPGAIRAASTSRYGSKAKGKRKMYRAYGDGIEFGIDYSTKEAAQEAITAFNIWFPRTKYYIRKVSRRRTSVLWATTPDGSIKHILEQC